MGTLQGLFIYHGDSTLSLPGKLKKIAIKTIIQTRDGEIFIATLDGLFRYTRGRFQHFDHHSGLLGNQVLSVSEDDKGDIWASTSDGISILSKKALNPHYKQKEPRVYITKARIGDSVFLSPIEIKSMSGHLPISVSIATVLMPSARGASAPIPNSGVWDTAWIQLSERELTLSHLKPGNYRLEIRTKKTGHTWSPHTAYADLTITPRLIETLFFKVLMLTCLVVLLIVSTWAVMKRRERLIRRKYFMKLKVTFISSSSDSFNDETSFRVQ